MKDKVLISTAVILSIAVCILYVQFQNISDQLNHIDEIGNQVKATSDTAVKRIESTVDSTRLEIEKNWKSKLQAESDDITKQHSKQFEKKLKDLKIAIAKEEDRLREIKKKKQRAQNGLPEQVDLDELNSNYAEK